MLKITKTRREEQPKEAVEKNKQDRVRLRPSGYPLPIVEEPDILFARIEREDFVQRIVQGDQTVLEQLMASPLTSREREVLQMSFGLGTEKLTTQKIGERLGIAHDRVNKIKEKALRRLKHCTHVEPLNRILGEMPEKMF